MNLWNFDLHQLKQLDKELKKKEKVTLCFKYKTFIQKNINSKTNGKPKCQFVMLLL